MEGGHQQQEGAEGGWQYDRFDGMCAAGLQGENGQPGTGEERGRHPEAQNGESPPGQASGTLSLGKPKKLDQ